MGIAVYDILQLSIFSKFNLIAGNQGLTRNVSAVNVLDYEFDLAKKAGHRRCHFDRDSFVVSSMLFAKDDPGEIVNAVRYLIEDHASGLAIKNIYYQDLSREVTDLADRMGFPIFIFDASAGPIEKIVTLINDRIRESESLEMKEAKLQLLAERRMDPAAVRAMALELNPKFLPQCMTVYLRARRHRTGGHLRHQVEYIGGCLDEHCGAYALRGGVLLVLTQEDPFTPDRALRQVDQVLVRCGVEPGEYAVAVSLPHDQLGELDLCVCESLYAMQYCELTGGGRADFSDLGVYQVILPHLDDVWFYNFYRRIVHPIMAYDAKYNSELMATARAYIRQGGNVGKTAQELSLHKNSIRYRLGKIREICGDQFQQDDFFVQLSLAVRLGLFFEKKDDDGTL